MLAKPSRASSARRTGATFMKLGRAPTMWRTVNGGVTMARKLGAGARPVQRTLAAAPGRSRTLGEADLVDPKVGTAAERADAGRVHRADPTVRVDCSVAPTGLGQDLALLEPGLRQRVARLAQLEHPVD